MSKNNFEVAREKYSEIGVDVNKAIEKLSQIPLSMQCWQGDDVGGFEKDDSTLSNGGIQVTGNYPGKARNIKELQDDLDVMYSLLPGKHRLNLHAIYGDFGGTFVDRDKIEGKHFDRWVEWAKEKDVKIDFNATCFSHPLADAGFTLSSKDKKTREFWINHVRCAREISVYIGKKQGTTCIHNLWIPDGSKDIPVDRLGYRQILKDSLDEIFKKEYDKKDMKDAVECKLFGIGSESYVVGSHEFYVGYAIRNNIMPCFDLGHFHPTELVADKISSILLFSDELLLHVSRPMRWDSDHIVIYNDDIIFLSQELVRSGRLNDIHIGLDFFDATVNRIGAWTIGARATLKGLLFALLEPTDTLKKYENDGNYFARLALLEEVKSMPFGLVWDYYCEKMNVPTDRKLIEIIQQYENDVLSKRSV